MDLCVQGVLAGSTHGTAQQADVGFKCFCFLGSGFVLGESISGLKD